MAETEGRGRELFEGVGINDIARVISLLDQEGSLTATRWVGVGVIQCKVRKVCIYVREDVQA